MPKVKCDISRTVCRLLCESVSLAAGCASVPLCELQHCFLCSQFSPHFSLLLERRALGFPPFFSTCAWPKAGVVAPLCVIYSVTVFYLNISLPKCSAKKSFPVCGDPTRSLCATRFKSGALAFLWLILEEYYFIFKRQLINNEDILTLQDRLHEMNPFVV